MLHISEGLAPGHTLFCDRFFTSLKLLEKLRDKGIACTGTIQGNRVLKECSQQFPSDNSMSKDGRGTSCTVVNKNNTVAVTKWFDNKSVLVASTEEEKDPEDECRHWSKMEKKYVDIKRPAAITKYNI